MMERWRKQRCRALEIHVSRIVVVEKKVTQGGESGKATRGVR